MMDRCAGAVSDDDIGARAFLKHIGEIFAPHHKRIFFTSTRHFGGRFNRILGFLIMVNHHGVAAVIIDLDVRSIGRADTGANRLDPLFGLVANIRVQRPHCAL